MICDTQAYLAEDIRRELGLHREELVALAYFLGCDYTDGVTGVGIVNALEIVQAFPMRLRNTADDGIPGGPPTDPDDSCDPCEGGDPISIAHYPIVGLKKFKEWLEGYKFSATVAAKQKSISKTSDRNKILKKDSKSNNSKQSRKRKKTKKRTKSDYNQSGSDSGQSVDSNSECSSESDADIDDNISKKDNNGSDTNCNKDHDNGHEDKGVRHIVALREASPDVQAGDSVKARRSSRKKSLITETAATEVDQSNKHDKGLSKEEGEGKLLGEKEKEKEKEKGKEEKREKVSEDAVVATSNNSIEIAMNHNKIFTKKTTRMVRFYLSLSLYLCPTMISDNSNSTITAYYHLLFYSVFSTKPTALLALDGA